MKMNNVIKFNNFTKIIESQSNNEQSIFESYNKEWKECFKSLSQFRYEYDYNGSDYNWLYTLVVIESGIEINLFLEINKSINGSWCFDFESQQISTDDIAYSKTVSDSKTSMDYKTLISELYRINDYLIRYNEHINDSYGFFPLLGHYS